MMNKDILAKLLAQENITVTQAKVETASFDVKQRVLTLPQWDGMENFTYNHLVGHEVGHALYTAEDDWKSALEGKTKGYKSFLNVVEDARIEKLIQRRYPGLRRDFVLSYKKLFADGFFGTNMDEINSLPLIDRLNTYFKCGTAFGVQFDEVEKTVAKEIEGIETFAEVVEITDRLYGEAVEKMKEEQEATQQMLDEMDAEDFEMEEQDGSGDGFFDPLDEEESESDNTGGADGSETDDEADDESNESETDSNANGEEDSDGEKEESETKDFSLGSEAGKSFEGIVDPSSITDESLNKNIEAQFTTGNQINNVFFSESDVSNHIIKAPQILDLLSETDYSYGVKHFKKFQANNKKAINYMVKEFEMKKKASEYARTSVSKTGVIDPVLMNNYRYSDDIFKKMAVTPEGKNHGLMMFIDWSGSMHQDMANTIDQLLNLVMFCKQVQIPFRVYAFTDRGYDWGKIEMPEMVAGETVYDKDWRLLEFFNSKTMKRAQVTKMLHLLSWVKSRMYYGYNWIPNALALGGTPLDHTIIASAKLFEEFQKENRLDIVNMVFLTDGDSHPSDYVHSYTDSNGQVNKYAMQLRSAYGSESVAIFRDKVTKKTYRMTRGDRYSSRGSITNMLLRRLRERTGANVIGYRIVPINKRHFQNEIHQYVNNYYESEKMHTELKKERFITIPNSGYTEFFALAGGKQLQASNGQIEVAESASKNVLRTAFKKANKSKKGSRVMLSKFIELVA